MVPCVSHDRAEGGVVTATHATRAHGRGRRAPLRPHRGCGASRRAAAVVVGLLAWCLPAASRSAVPDVAAVEFFEKEVRPLLVTHCYECHANGKSDGGLSLDTLSLIHI